MATMTKSWLLILTEIFGVLLAALSE